MTDKTRISISAEAKALLLEIKKLHNYKTISEAAETLIALTGERFLEKLRAIKSDALDVPQSVTPSVRQLAKQPVKQRQSTFKPMEF